MPNGKKSYKVGEEVYDIPSNEVNKFITDFPGAIEVETYLVGKDTFDIPIPEVKSFLASNPKAEKKKKVSGVSSIASGKLVRLDPFGEKAKPVEATELVQPPVEEAPLVTPSGFSFTESQVAGAPTIPFSSRKLTDEDIAAYNERAELQELSAEERVQFVENMTSENLPYVMKAGYNQSLIGLTDQILTGDQRFDTEKYDANTLEEIGAIAVGFFIDAPFFMLTGGVGGVAARGAVKTTAKLLLNQAGKQAEKALIKKGATKELAQTLVKKGMGKNAEKVARMAGALEKAPDIAQAVGASGTALGSYGAVHEAMREMTEEEKSFEELDWAKIRDEGYINGMLGLGLGALGLGGRAVERMITKSPMGSRAKLAAISGEKVTTFGAETGMFVYGDRLIRGEEIGNVTAVDWANAAKMVLGARISGVAQKGIKFIKDKTFSEEKVNTEDFEINLTPAELRLLNKGETTKDVIDDLKGKSDVALTDILADETIPLTAKQKLLWSLKGVRPEKNQEVSEISIDDVEGRAVMTVRNEEGMILESKDYDSREMAESDALKIMAEIKERENMKVAESLTIDEKFEAQQQLKDKGLSSDLLNKALDVMPHLRTLAESKIVEEFNEVVNDIAGKREKPPAEEPPAEPAPEPTIEPARYEIDGKEVTKEEMEAEITKPDFEERAKAGKIDVKIENDPELQAKLAEVAKLPPEEVVPEKPEEIPDISKDLQPLAQKAREAKDVDEFITEGNTVPIETITDPGIRDVIIKKLGKIESKTPDAPIVVEITPEGKLEILDGAQRYYQKIDTGIKDIDIRFTPEQKKQNTSFYEKANKPVEEKPEEVPKKPEVKPEEEKTKKINRLLDLKQAFNAKTTAERTKDTETRERILKLAAELEYTVEGTDKIDIKTDGTSLGRPKEVLEKEFAPLEKRSEKTQTFVKDVSELSKAAPETIMGIGMSKTSIEQAVRNIEEGKDTKAAREFIDIMDTFAEQGYVEIRVGKGIDAQWFKMSLDEFTGKAEAKEELPAEEVSDEAIEVNEEINEIIATVGNKDGSINYIKFSEQIESRPELFEPLFEGKDEAEIETLKSTINEQATKQREGVEPTPAITEERKQLIADLEDKARSAKTADEYQAVLEEAERLLKVEPEPAKPEEKPPTEEVKLEVIRGQRADAFDRLVESFGGKAAISGEKRPDAIKALQDITKSFADELGLRGEALYKKVREFIKDKIDIKFLDENREEIMGELEKEVKAEKPAVEKEIVQPEEETPVYVDDNVGFNVDLGAKTKRFFKKYFTPKGLLPKKAFDLKIKMEGRTNAMLNDIKHTSKKFRSSLKEAYGVAPISRKIKISKAETENIDKVLKGELAISEIPSELRESVQDMRNQIDALSQMLIDEGLVEGKLIGKIQENLGTYMTRSYEVHDNPKWAEKVPAEIKNRAIAFLRSQYPDLNATELKGVINEILDTPDSPLTILASGKIGSKDLGILKKRKDIAPEVRALLGEYTDPLLNYAKSITKMANLISNSKFLNEMKDAGLNDFLFEKPTDTRYRKIATEGSKTMEPLNGLYTTPEIAEAFETMGKPEQLPSYLRHYMKVNGIVKYSKTILSLMTHVRNLVGNTGFAVMNGHYRAGKFNPAIKTTITELGTVDNKDFRDRYKKYLRLGIVNESSRAFPEKIFYIARIHFHKHISSKHHLLPCKDRSLTVIRLLNTYSMNSQ